MRILMIHNRYQVRGGEDESTENEIALLRSAGHCVDFLEADNSRIGSVSSAFKASMSATWSQEWYTKTLQELRRHKYDVVHVQNFFPQISPSVHFAATRAGVPSIQTLRNYRIACPSANLFRDGTFCDKCVGHSIKHPAIRHACFRGNRLATTSVVAMLATHKKIGTWSRKVSGFIAISEYVASIARREGVPDEKLFVKANFVNPTKVKAGASLRARKHFLYVGRLSQEKGLSILLNAYRRCGVNVPLLIVGEGEQGQGKGQENVFWLGRRSLDQVYALMADAVAVIMPGQWPEPFGRVAVEAFAAGTPVISSNIGGVAEIVEHGKSGYLVPPNDCDGLAQAMRSIYSEGLADAMGQEAYSAYERHYTAYENERRLVGIYESVQRDAK